MITSEVGDEIIEHFPVDCLYIAEYDDSYQLAAHGKDVTDPYYYEDADGGYAVG